MSSALLCQLVLNLNWAWFILGLLNRAWYELLKYLYNILTIINELSIVYAMSQAVLEPLITQDSSLDAVAWVFKALGDPARLKILQHLATEASGKCCGTGAGVCACDFEEVTGLKQPTVSHHMKCLMSAQLVIAEKKGKWMFYHINPKGFALIEGVLNVLVA